MDAKWLAIIAIGDLVISKGLPAAIRLMQTLQADTATVEDIRALRDQGLRPAADYFNGNAGAPSAE